MLLANNIAQQQKEMERELSNLERDTYAIATNIVIVLSHVEFKVKYYYKKNNNNQKIKQMKD